MPPMVVAGVMMATIAAGTALSATAATRQGQVAGDTALLNAKLRAKELISQAQASEYQAKVGEQDALMSERNAILSERAAGLEREATAFDVVQARNQGRAFLAQQRAQVGGAGLEASGSPLLVMAASARQLELDQMVTTHEGELRAQAQEEQARMDQFGAVQARHGADVARYTAGQQRKGIPLTLDIGRYQARAARQAGQLAAVSSLISGAGKGVGAYYGAGAK